MVRSLLLKNHEFRGICEDYEIARDAFERWSHYDHAEAKLRAAEFAAISRELEVEIERYLIESV